MKKVIFLAVAMLCFVPTDGQVTNWLQVIGDSVFTSSSNRDLVMWNMEIESGGSIHLLGTYQGWGSNSLDLNPNPGAYAYAPAPTTQDLFHLKLNSAGKYVSSQVYPSQLYASGNCLAIDRFDNAHIMGPFSGTVDFDPGLGVSPLTSTDSTLFSAHTFVQKLNPQGGLEWVIQVGNTVTGADTSEIYGDYMDTDQEGNVLIAGTCRGTVDFDPGPGTQVEQAGKFSVFILKLDSTGQFQWVTLFWGPNLYFDFSFDNLGTDGQGNVLMSARFRGTMDFDPGPGSYDLTSQTSDPNENPVVVKLSSDGDFQWVKLYGGSGGELLKSYIKGGADGSIYTAGVYRYKPDFDASADTSYLESYNWGSGTARNMYVCKWNSLGEFEWVRDFQSHKFCLVFDFNLGKNGYLYLAGTSERETDFDPGPGIEINNSLSPNAFFVKLDQEGNYLDHRSLVPNSFGSALGVDERNQSIVWAGKFQASTNFAEPPATQLWPLTLNADGPAFIWKMDKDSCSGLLVSEDSLVHVTCADSGLISIAVEGGTPPYSYTWSQPTLGTDSFITTRTPGLYQVTVTDSTGCQQETGRILRGPSSLQQKDMNVQLAAGQFRNGFPAWIWVDLYNFGCEGDSVPLTLIHDSYLSFDSSSVPLHSQSGDTLTFHTDSLVYNSGRWQAQLFFTVPVTPQQDSVCFEVSVPDSGDAFPLDNAKKYKFPVVNSFDPNDKQVFPQGVCANKLTYLRPEEPLTYTLRFQNTGTASALSVYLLDTISTHLNLQTTRVVASSHPYTVELLPNRVLRFDFPGIELPPESQDAPGSMGFIAFEIKPVNNLPSETLVENGVSIYFDFNAPVITNTVFNTLIDTLPPPCSSTNLNPDVDFVDFIRLVPNPSTGEFTIFTKEPINSAQIQIYNVEGKQIYNKFEKKLDNTRMDIPLPKGLFLLRITDGNGRNTCKRLLIR